MTTTIRCHFDGKVLVPEEPVDWPVGQTFTVEIQPGAVFVDPPSGRSTVEDLRRAGIVGMWAHRTDIKDSVQFARQLRKRASEVDKADDQ
jgi:hypothetical protein